VRLDRVNVRSKLKVTRLLQLRAALAEARGNFSHRFCNSFHKLLVVTVLFGFQIGFESPTPDEGHMHRQRRQSHATITKVLCSEIKQNLLMQVMIGTGPDFLQLQNAP